MRVPGIALLVLATACEANEPAAPGEGVAGPTAVAGLAAPTPTGDVGPQPGDPAALPVAGVIPVGAELPAGLVLPAGWQGLGVLALAPESPPKKAPAWVRSLAEVVARDDKHFLETTGRADRIKNAALARSTAENRARAEMAKWLASERLTMSQVTEVYVDKRSRATFVRVAIEVPIGWYPGQAAVGDTPPAPAPVTP